jgi:hypothetical protein
VSRIEKLIARFKLKPKIFYGELITLLQAFGYTEWKSENKRIRRAFVNSTTKHVIHLHKPHPGNELRQYQIQKFWMNLLKVDIYERCPKI